MNVIRDEKGQWWVVDEKGREMAGPFPHEEQAWQWMDMLED